MDETKMMPSPPPIRDILANEAAYTVTKMNVKPGLGSAPHNHPHKQFIYILSGRGMFLLGDEAIELTAGSYLAIPGDVPHTFRAVYEEITWLEFFSPGREDF